MPSYNKKLSPKILDLFWRLHKRTIQTDKEYSQENQNCTNKA